MTPKPLTILTLERATHNSCDLHRIIPKGALVLWVRYSKKNLTVLFKS